MPMFTKKPVAVEAIQWTGKNWAEIERFTEGRAEMIFASFTMVVHTREGRLYAPCDSWIIKGIAGEVYPCDPDIFKATYDPVE